MLRKRSAMNSHAWFALAALLATSALVKTSGTQLADTFTRWLDHPAINYKSTEPTDSVARLSRRLQDGSVRLKSDGPSGYLRSVLDALDVPIESQIAVFVPDSVQARRINPGNPRTLFFSDNVVVGWVRGGFIEIAAQDRRQGIAFYAMDQALFGSGGARIARRDDCLSCHYSYSTAGVPGVVVRSSGQFAVDHRVGLEARWGGWYVTGTHGSIRHLGNTHIDQLFSGVPTATSGNWPSLDGKFDWTGYLTPHSDIVALMVFDHQMHLMNLLTRIGWEARVAAHERRPTNPQSAADSAGDRSERPISLAAAASEVVDYMLFVEEAPLADTVHGSSGFAAKFEARGPRDRTGRSLRQLDLTRRLFRYPCSYMIYSDVFTALPPAAKAAIYDRMWAVLSGQEKSARYARLSRQDRQDIIQILRDTKSDLPPSFQASAL
jgi:hypothetical protein